MAPVSYLSAKCQVYPSRLGGRGVFAAAPVAAGEILAIWGGRIYVADELRRIAAEYPSLLLHPLTVADGLYLGPADPSADPDPAEFFNHSCDPNAGVKGQVILIARRGIAAGEEVCFDYETTECEESVGMGFSCRCGAVRCRGRIAGAMWHDRGFQERNRGYMSWYLQAKLAAEWPASQPEGPPCCS